MADRLRALPALGIALACLGLLGCGGITRMQPLRIGRPASLDASQHFEEMLVVARSRGYLPDPVQPERSRFGVHLHYTDEYVAEYGPYRAAIVCAGGVCDIRPIGPRVEHHQGQLLLPQELREELEELQAALDHIGHVR